jgi:hypothetical protein
MWLRLLLAFRPCDALCLVQTTVAAFIHTSPDIELSLGICLHTWLSETSVHEHFLWPGCLRAVRTTTRRNARAKSAKLDELCHLAGCTACCLRFQYSGFYQGLSS